MKQLRKTVSIALASGILLGSVAGSAMSDIGNSWAKSYIERLAEKGILIGYEDGTFKPDKNITREEASKIISEYIGNSEVPESEKLSDIEDRWSTKFIKHLVSKGIVTGYTDGTFKPEKNITRAEFATIVCRYLESEGLMEGADTSEVNLWDIESNWAKEYIKKVAAKGYINGYPNGSFKPNNLITRAEVSAIIALMDGAEKPETNLGLKVASSSEWIKDPKGRFVVYSDPANEKLPEWFEKVKNIGIEFRDYEKAMNPIPSPYFRIYHGAIEDGGNTIESRGYDISAEFVSHPELNRYKNILYGQTEPDDKVWNATEWFKEVGIHMEDLDHIVSADTGKKIQISEGEIVRLKMTVSKGGYSRIYYLDVTHTEYDK